MAVQIACPAEAAPPAGGARVKVALPLQWADRVRVCAAKRDRAGLDLTGEDQPGLLAGGLQIVSSRKIPPDHPRYRRAEAAMSDESVSEDQCALCSRVRPGERAAFRANLDRIPLKEAICDACLMAWARNVGFPVPDDDAAEH